jgi:hypothetical protein
MKLIFQKVFFLFVLLMAASTGQAQRFNGGLLAGGDVSQVDGDTYDGYHKLCQPADFTSFVLPDGT